MNKKKSDSQNNEEVYKKNKNYTRNQNISDANRAYQEKVAQQRGILGQQESHTFNDKTKYDFKNTKEGTSTSKDDKNHTENARASLHKQHESAKEKDDFQSGENTSRGNDNYKDNTKVPVHRQHKTVVDYGRNQNISDADRAYQEKVVQQRGIHSQQENHTFDDETKYDFKNHKEETSIGRDNESYTENARASLHKQHESAKEKDDFQSGENTSRGNNNYKDNIKVPVHGQHETVVDYGRNQNISDADRAYQEKVAQQRGIHNQQENHTFDDEIKYDFKNTKEGTSTSKDNKYYTENTRIPLHKQHESVKEKNGFQNVQNGENISRENNNYKDNTKAPVRGQHESSVVDYRRNQNISDADRVYQEKVAQQRGIHNQQENHTFNDETKVIFKNSEEKMPNNLEVKKPTKNTDIRIVDNKSKDLYYVSSINRYRGIDKSKIRNKGIDLSELYEKSAKSGERYSELAKTFGASEDDIVKLLETRKLKPRTNLTFKLGKGVKNVLSTSSTYIYETSTSNTDAAQGLRTIKKATDPIWFMILDSSMMSLDKAMKTDLSNCLNKLASEHKVFGNPDIVGPYIVNPELGIDSVDLRLLKNELIKEIEKTGKIKLNKKDSIVLQQQIRGYLRVNKDKLTDSEVGALKMLLQVAKADTMEKSIIRKRKVFRSKMMMRSFRFLQQSDAGAGMFFIYNFIRRAKNTLTLGLNTIMTAAKIVALAGKLTYRASAKAAAKLAKTKLGQKLANSKTGKKTSDILSKRKQKKISKKNEHNVKKSLLKKAKEFRNDPFRLRSNKKKYIGKLKNTKIGRAVSNFLSPYTLVKKAIGNAVSTIMSALSFILSALMTGLLLFIIVIVIIVFLFSIQSAIMSMFDFSDNEEKIQTAALEKIQSCYEEQNKIIESFFDGRYASVSVTYNDIRDEEEYAKEDNQPYEPFKETTNSAEILSMAQIYFDFDLEEAGENKVVEYIEKLFNGSHLINLIEKPIYGKDKDGNEVIIETHAKITLDTYYFNSIFQCELLDNSMSGAMGGVLAGNSISDQVWNYLRTAGFTEEAAAAVMGNLYQESGMDPTKLQNGVGPAAGLLQMEKYKDYSTRWGRMAKKAEAKGKEWTDLESQLEFLIEDMPEQFRVYTGRSPHYYKNGEWCWWPEKVTVDQFKKLTDIDKATEIFERVFLRASKPNMPRRIKHAHLYYETYHGRGLVTISGTYTNPCPGARVSSEFGPRKPPTAGASSYHNGIDLAAPSGKPILASKSGKVIKVVPATSGGARGNYIVIDHGNGVETLYQHMKNRAIPNVGDMVQQGQKIGEVGNTGIGTGAHLHFEIHINGKPVNPRSYVKF